MDELSECPCGAPIGDVYYWHKITQHDCIHHARIMTDCEECELRRLSDVLASEVEEFLKGAT